MTENEQTETEGTVRFDLPPIPDPEQRPGESAHAAFHRRSLLPDPSGLCAVCVDDAAAEQDG